MLTGEKLRAFLVIIASGDLLSRAAEAAACAAASRVRGSGMNALQIIWSSFLLRGRDKAETETDSHFSLSPPTPPHSLHPLKSPNSDPAARLGANVGTRGPNWHGSAPGTFTLAALSVNFSPKNK